MTTHEHEIKEIVDRESRAWETQDVKLLMTVFHPEMTRPLPPGPQVRHAREWQFWVGHYDYQRWSRNWQNLFNTYTLVHNRHAIRKIAFTPEHDVAFAVVEVDTLWRDRRGKEFHWQGRACEVYTKLGTEWKMMRHTGLLDYGKLAAPAAARPAGKQTRSTAFPSVPRAHLTPSPRTGATARRTPAGPQRARA